MDFRFDDDTLEIKRMVRDFVRDEVEPVDRKSVV